MDAEFWLQRWRDGQTGFHRPEVNPRLVTYWPQLHLQPGDQVFVPLCGKSLDLLWLRERYAVLGVELSPLAVDAFFQENALEPEHDRQGAFAVCRTERLTLLCGDFFDLQPASLVRVKGVYDRAALIALPQAMRPRYVEHLTALLPPATPMLLVTLDYDQSQMDGPPFSVTEPEVEALFGRDWSIRCLHREDILDGEPRFRARGLSSLSEKVYLLEKQ
ncbi:MAG TPA: thiopurine S-methyltransferase [Gammaproteobacteria bacterium]|nr:thiopurine S-methyltransferase [Gammaproteobacteria bacterium]